MLDLITLTGIPVRVGTYVFFLGLIRAYKCTPRNQPRGGLMQSMVVNYCLTPKNKRPRFAISTASSSSLPSPAVHRSSGPMVSEVFPLRNAASNADLRALSDAMRRGSECPVKMITAVRGGREECNALRWALRFSRTGAKISGVGVGIRAGAGASADAFGVVPEPSQLVKGAGK